MGEERKQQRQIRPCEHGRLTLCPDCVREAGIAAQSASTFYTGPIGTPGRRIERAPMLDEEEEE